MDKYLQDLAWSILPKEFKEEVKGQFRDGFNDDRNAIGRLFGIDNLLSDAEGEEMLMVSRKEVMKHFREANLDRIYHPNDSKDYAQATGRKIMLVRLFGKDKCLPDDKANEKVDENISDENFSKVERLEKNDEPKPVEPKKSRCEECGVPNSTICAYLNCQEYISQSEPKPAEPKFKIGDKVKHSAHPHDDGIYRVDDIKKSSDGFIYHIQGLIGISNVKESDIEPYTEPEKESRNLSKNIANCDKQLDNILKDSFRKHNRLHVASMVLQGIMANPNEQMINMNINDTLNLTLRMTDALLYECEEGGKS